MKKLLCIITALALAAGLAGCGTQAPDEAISDISSRRHSENSESGGRQKKLVVYFSHTGTTETVAQEIRRQTGADIFCIEPRQPYTDDYSSLLDLAGREKENGECPQIAAMPENIGRYDTVYVGYPIWWGDMPMILYTFFDSRDFSGLTVVPFCISGGSGLCDTPSAIARLEPEANVTRGLHISSSRARQCQQQVSRWLEETGTKQ